jgi:4-diphosphocytidyl-2-C-methyl-D-erythritol kinase
MPEAGLKHLLVVTPGVQVSTTDAYAGLKAPALTTPVPKSILAVSRDEAFSSDSTQWALSELLENDFERVIFDIEPEIQRAKNALLQAGARGALLAGSGSSVFGIFDNLEKQERARKEIKRERGWRVFPCATITRQEYSSSLSKIGV